MNDGGYGVIKNIADAYYGGRRAYVDILGPDWGLMCDLGIPHWRVDTAGDISEVLKSAFEVDGPALIEVDMSSIGEFAWWGLRRPPVKTAPDEK